MSAKTQALTDPIKRFEDQQFKELDFIKTVFEAKIFDNCEFINCNFTECTFLQCKFNECTFKNCNLSNLIVTKSAFYDVDFFGSKMIGINWTKAAWSSIKVTCPLKFTQCILNDSSFMGLCLREIVMVECKAHDVDFRDCDCLEGDFTYTDFANSLFSHTNLTKANFTESSNYTIDVYLNEIKKAKFSLPEAVNLLNCLEIELID